MTLKNLKKSVKNFLGELKKKPAGKRRRKFPSALKLQAEQFLLLFRMYGDNGEVTETSRDFVAEVIRLCYEKQFEVPEEVMEAAKAFETTPASSEPSVASVAEPVRSAPKQMGVTRRSRRPGAHIEPDDSPGRHVGPGNREAKKELPVCQNGGQPSPRHRELTPKQNLLGMLASISAGRKNVDFRTVSQTFFDLKDSGVLGNLSREEYEVAFKALWFVQEKSNPRLHIFPNSPGVALEFFGSAPVDLSRSFVFGDDGLIVDLSARLSEAVRNGSNLDQSIEAKISSTLNIVEGVWRGGLTLWNTDKKRLEGFLDLVDRFNFSEDKYRLLERVSAVRGNVISSGHTGNDAMAEAFSKAGFTLSNGHAANAN